MKALALSLLGLLSAVSAGADASQVQRAVLQAPATVPVTTYRVKGFFVACESKLDAEWLSYIIEFGDTSSARDFEENPRSCFSLRGHELLRAIPSLDSSLVIQIRLSDHSLVWTPILVLQAQQPYSGF